MDDSKFPLRRIRNDSDIPIIQAMKEMQTAKYERGGASFFVSQLKCLRLVHNGENIKFEEDQINLFDKNCDDCAIASWSWKPSKYEHKVPVRGKCLIGTRASDVRNSVWERAAAYMDHKDVECLWIDTECIPQEDSNGKEKAMSEMDLLYHHGSHPFGLLTRPVNTGTELDLLADILESHLLHWSEDKSEFSLRRLTPKAWKAVQLLDEITSDIWWTRAWIFQENYHGGKDMFLLMPHDDELESLKANHVHLFGSLEGELIIKSIKFSEGLTDLCSAFINSDPPGFQAEVARRVLSAAGRYSALLKSNNSMSPTVIADVGKRHVTEFSDRLPIISNCCSYNVRLSMDKLKRGSSISLATLALFLLNGDILYCDPNEKRRHTRSASCLTITELIQRYAFNQFSPPESEYMNPLTFNKGCRFVDVELGNDGVHTHGHLWQLWERAIEISDWQLKKWKTVKQTLWGFYHSIKVRPHQAAIASQLKDFLNRTNGADWKMANSADDRYRCILAKTLADSIKRKKTLKLGYIPNLEFSDPMAIFICPDEVTRENDGPVFAFTSFKAMETSDGPEYDSDVHKHVSLQVDIYDYEDKLTDSGSIDSEGSDFNDIASADTISKASDTEASGSENVTGSDDSDDAEGRYDNEQTPPELFARCWMHGLWFETEPTRHVLFPFPRVLSELGGV